ncbi:hypothetical protein WJX75_002648 [Coccomyxa subellipsoidea]|uniref:Cyclin-like domain-containing protein n=1 Tax=Coccomyxa subellipsoidea TaxID=248742 RepID=A0ABR2YWG3_9CHLO
MIYTNLDNFYVSKESLERSPSRQDGVSEDTETELRIFGATLIQAGGCLLQLPQVVMATGQVLFHRFFCKESMAKFDVEKVAWTCCWLATKLEEIPRRVRDVLAVFYRLQRRRQDLSLEPLDFYGSKYEEMKLELIRVERMMLREFGFIVHVEHPHKLVLNHLHMMLGSGHQELMQEAWSLTNDSLRTTLCVRLKSEVVACGIIFMAARRLKVPLPEDPPWWELHNVTFEDICEVCSEVQSLYQRPPARYVAVTRGVQASSAAATPQASALTGQGSPANSLGLAGAASGRGAAAVDSSAQPLVTSGLDAAGAPLQNGVEIKEAAPGKEKEEDGKQHRTERRRSKERERERDRAHRDREAERARLDERGGRREGASELSRSRRDAGEAGHKRSRTGDPLQERESRRVRVVEYSDRARERAERPPAAQDGSDKGLDRWRSDAYRRAHSSSSALHQESERATRGGGVGMDIDRNHAEKRPANERLMSSADRETRRLDERLRISGKPSERAAGSMSDSPRSSRANGSLSNRIAQYQPSPEDSFEGNGASKPLRLMERSSPSDQDGSVENGSGRRRLRKADRSRSRSNSVDVPSPGSFLKGHTRSPVGQVMGGWTCEHQITGRLYSAMACFISGRASATPGQFEGITSMVLCQLPALFLARFDGDEALTMITEALCCPP